METSLMRRQSEKLSHKIIWHDGKIKTGKVLRAPVDYFIQVKREKGCFNLKSRKEEGREFSDSLSLFSLALEFIICSSDHLTQHSIDKHTTVNPRKKCMFSRMNRKPNNYEPQRLSSEKSRTYTIFTQNTSNHLQTEKNLLLRDEITQIADIVV